MQRRIRQSRCAESDRGFVTAETAIVLPVLLLLLGVALWSIAVAGARLRCIDAARAGARAAARGEAAASVVAAAEAAGPAGAVVRVRRSGDRVTVVVQARVGPVSGVLASVPAPVVAATAVAVAEATS